LVGLPSASRHMFYALIYFRWRYSLVCTGGVRVDAASRAGDSAIALTAPGHRLGTTLAAVPTAELLTRDEAQRIAANIVKLPGWHSESTSTVMLVTTAVSLENCHSSGSPGEVVSFLDHASSEVRRPPRR
jgi:hypothetical protein